MKELDDKSVSSSVSKIALIMAFFRWLKVFFSDPWRRVILLCPLVIMLCNSVPSFYAWNADIPKAEDIHYIKGELALKRNNKKGIQLGVKNNNKIEYFSCENELNIGNLGCGVNKDLLSYWSGKQVEIGWFYQPAYFFYSQRRLVSLKVEGEEEISFDDVSKEISLGRKEAVGYILMDAFGVFLLLFLIRVFIYKKQK